MKGWTEDQDAAIRATYQVAGDGPVNLRALATVLGRTFPAVATRAHRLGVTARGRSRGEGHAQRFQEHIRQSRATKGHPRGMLGVRHSAETRKRMSAAQQALSKAGHASGSYHRTREWREKRSATTALQLRTSNVYSRCRHGRRPDLGDCYFRSAWEANYARFLNLLKAQGQVTRWEYEAETFWFERIRRGVRSYTPDFKVWEPSGTVYYVEVKGWMDAKSRTKLKRMKKYHPTVDVRLVGQKAYQEIARKLGKAIPGWEAA